MTTQLFRHLNGTHYSAPLLAPDPLISQEEMVSRIEDIRLGAGPVACPTCGSSAGRVCNACHELRPLSAFRTVVTNPLGIGYACRRCERKRDASIKRRRKITVVREILGRAG